MSFARGWKKGSGFFFGTPLDQQILKNANKIHNLLQQDLQPNVGRGEGAVATQPSAKDIAKHAAIEDKLGKLCKQIDNYIKERKKIMDDNPQNKVYQQLLDAIPPAQLRYIILEAALGERAQDLLHAQQNNPEMIEKYTHGNTFRIANDTVTTNNSVLVLNPALALIVFLGLEKISPAIESLVKNIGVALESTSTSENKSLEEDLAHEEVQKHIMRAQMTTPGTLEELVDAKLPVSIKNAITFAICVNILEPQNHEDENLKRIILFSQSFIELIAISRMLNNMEPNEAKKEIWNNLEGNIWNLFEKLLKDPQFIKSTAALYEQLDEKKKARDTDGTELIAQELRNLENIRFADGFPAPLLKVWASNFITEVQVIIPEALRIGRRLDNNI